ncbi:helix-turn-helix domain-containing protein [Kineosporia succinea]|uniref:AraC family transcriptional regulator n=1 Tax=Kineosporia succinea TaxID=84632 RepID=A0ABT9P9W4_9ACTN|nr:AraC family transcriptional regulator [Kineosporia succinea]MDP9829489.1 AraC family transcriptional regulator [Kineosporia succinea]
MSRPGLPSRLLRSSSHLGWNGVRLEEYEDPFVTEAFHTRGESLTLVRVTTGRYRIESRAGGRWRADDYRPGSVGVTAPGHENVLRWRASAPVVMRSQHVHLDPALVPAGAASPDALSLDDPYVTASVQALATALDDEAPALYADAVAAALVAHLVHRVGARAVSPVRAGALSAGEVRLVVDFMHEHLSEDVTLEQLSALVGLSKFHFLRLFRSATGETPARFLAKVRLRQGARSLSMTPESVAAVAIRCGYRSAGQFAAAFRREYGCTPRAYRQQSRGI